QSLRSGGMGHTMPIHAPTQQVILEFGLHKPAYRVIVNSPTTHGSVGLSTGLDPAMTLGCGGFGGNITSDNISPRHLLNIKRLAYEVTPVVSRWDRASGSPLQASTEPSGARPSGPALPQAPARPPAPAGIGAEALSRRIDAFLSSRGYRGEGGVRSDSSPTPRAQSDSSPTAVHARAQTPLTFVCEDDVRAAIQAGRKLTVSERAI